MYCVESSSTGKGGKKEKYEPKFRFVGDSLGQYGGLLQPNAFSCVSA